jgi:hypothetical protein
MNRKELKSFVNRLKAAYRVAKGTKKNQTLLSEFIEHQPESKFHKEAKIKIARKLEETGKKVFLEKNLNINGISFRADVCFLEDGKWNIIEVEYGNDHQNTIFRNYNTLSKLVDIKVIDIKKNSDITIENVERYLEVKRQIRGV